MCFPVRLNSGSLYKCALHAGTVQSVGMRSVVLTAPSLQRMVTPLTRRPRSGEMLHDVPYQSPASTVIVGGSNGTEEALREICLRFEMDTWEAAERSRAADSSGCLHYINWGGRMRLAQQSTVALLTDVPPQSLGKGVVLVLRTCAGSGHATYQSHRCPAAARSTRTARVVTLSISGYS
jgi:hypothetical protein